MTYWYFDSCRQPQQQHRSSQQNSDRSYLDHLQGKHVKINRGGPNSIVGKLVSVESDYLVVWTVEGITYVKTSHIKSITDLGGSSGHRSGKHHKKGNFIHADNFKGVLRALDKKFVQVNWGGPERVEGFLADVGKTHILVVSDHKKVDILIEHIQSVKTELKRSSGGNTGGYAGERSSGSSGGRSGGTAGAQGCGKKMAARRAAAPASKGTALKRPNGR